MTSPPDPTPNPAAQVDPSKVPLSQIVRGLTAGQAWKLGGTVLAIVLAVAAAGRWVEGWQRDQAVADAIAPKNAQISELSGKVDQLEGAISAAAAANEDLDARLADTKRFIAFADKYITYLQSEHDPARSIFADHVCMLYRESQEADIGVNVDRTSLDDVMRAVRGPQTRDWLVALGISQALADEIVELNTVGIRRALPNISRTVNRSVEPASVARVAPFNVNPRPISASDPRAQQIAADVAKRLSGQAGELIKVVSFQVEGRTYSYTMPPEIAGIVHNKAECRLR